MKRELGKWQYIDLNVGSAGQVELARKTRKKRSCFSLARGVQAL